MNLDQIAPKEAFEEGRDLSLRHPGTNKVLIDEDTKEPVTINVLGRDSKAYIEAQQKIANKTLARMTSTGKVKVTAEESEDDSLDITAACVKSWKHVNFGGSNEFLCTPANVKELLTTCRWIREQIVEFIGDRANFLGNA